MKDVWTEKLKKLLVLLSGYFSFLTFALVGGYVLVKSEDKELRHTAFVSFIITLISTAVFALLTIYSSIGGMFLNYYGSGAYVAYQIMYGLATIANTIAFAVFAIFILFDINFNSNRGINQKKGNNKKDDDLQIKMDSKIVGEEIETVVPSDSVEIETNSDDVEE